MAKKKSCVIENAQLRGIKKKKKTSLFESYLKKLSFSFKLARILPCTLNINQRTELLDNVAV